MNYLKKKIKGHKKGHDDDDDFDFEPSPASAEQRPPKANLEKDSEEWKFFQQLTQRVQDTVEKSQTTLNKLKDTSAVEEISKPDYEFIDDPAITKVVPTKSASWVDFDEKLKKEGLIPADPPVTARPEGKAPPPRPPPPKTAKSVDSVTEDTQLEAAHGEAAINLLDEFGFQSEPAPAHPAVLSAVVNGLYILDDDEDELQDDKDDPFDTSFVTESVAGTTPQAKTPTDFLSDLVLAPSTPDKQSKTSAQSIYESSRNATDLILDPLHSGYRPELSSFQSTPHVLALEEEEEENLGPDPFDTSFVNELDAKTRESTPKTDFADPFDTTSFGSSKPTESVSKTDYSDPFDTTSYSSSKPTEPVSKTDYSDPFDTTSYSSSKPTESVLKPDYSDPFDTTAYSSSKPTESVLKPDYSDPFDTTSYSSSKPTESVPKTDFSDPFDTTSYSSSKPAESVLKADFSDPFDTTSYSSSKQTESASKPDFVDPFGTISPNADNLLFGDEVQTAPVSDPFDTTSFGASSTNEPKLQASFTDPFGTTSQTASRKSSADNLLFGREEKTSDPFDTTSFNATQTSQSDYSDPFGKASLDAPKTTESTNKSDFVDPFGTTSHTASRKTSADNLLFGGGDKVPDPFDTTSFDGNKTSETTPRAEFEDPFGASAFSPSNTAESTTKAEFEDPFGASAKNDFLDPFGTASHTASRKSSADNLLFEGKTAPIDASKTKESTSKYDFADQFNTESFEPTPKADFADPFQTGSFEAPKTNESTPKADFVDPFNTGSFEAPKTNESTPKADFADPFNAGSFEAPKTRESTPKSDFADTFTAASVHASRKSSVDHFLGGGEDKALPLNKETNPSKNSLQEEDDMSNPFLTDPPDASPSIPKFPSGRRRSTNPFEDDILEQAGDLLASSFAETALAASNLTAEITNFATENAKLFDQLESKSESVQEPLSLGSFDHVGPSSSLPFGSPPSATEQLKPTSNNFFDVFGGPSPVPTPSVPSMPTDFHRKLSGGKIDADPFGLNDNLPSTTTKATGDLFGFGSDDARESEPKAPDSSSSLWLTEEPQSAEKEETEPFSLPVSIPTKPESAVSQVISSLEKIASFVADDLDDFPPPSTLMGSDFNLPITEVDEPSSIGEYPSLSPPEKVDDHPVGDLFDSFSMGTHYVKETDSRKNSETINPFGDAKEKTPEKEETTVNSEKPPTSMTQLAFGGSQFDQTFDSLGSSNFSTNQFDQGFDSLASVTSNATSKDPFDFSSPSQKTSTFDGSAFDQAFGSMKPTTGSNKDPFDLLGGDAPSNSESQMAGSDNFSFEPVKDSIPITDTAAFEAFAAKFEQVIEKYDTGAEPELLGDDNFDPFGTSSVPSSVAGAAGKGSGFDVVDMFDPFLSMTKPPENTPIKIADPVATKKMPVKQPSRDSFDDDDEVDFTVVIRPKMIDKSDAPKGSLEPPPLLPPPPKSPMKDPREQSAIPASRFNPFNKDFGFSLDVGKGEPAVNLLASPPNEIEPIPALGEAGVKKSGDTPESPRTPLFDEDTSQPLEEFPPKLDIEGWDLMLRQPGKKKITGNRCWKKVYVKLSENSILQLFNKKEDNDPFQELPLQACYSLSEVGAQQYDAYGKIFTVKFNYTFYRERMGVRPGQISKVMHGQITSVGQIAKLGLPLEHAPQVSQLLKLGSQTYNDVKTFVQIMEDALFHLSVHRDRALTYKTEEIQIAVHDELYVEQRRDGHVEKQVARVRLFFLAFISGMPNVEVGLNDLLREGKEVVGRYDIIPVVTEEWIRLENWDFHSCVVQEEFEKTRIVKLLPPDACLFELMRFRIRPPKNRELPLQVKCSMRITSMRVEMRADILVPGYHSRKHGQVPCEDIQIRFPLPECWIYLFRVEKHFRYGSLKSAARKPGKIKGLERIMGTAQNLDTSLIEVSTGQAKYEHSFKSVVWRIPRLPKEGQGAYTTQLFLLRLDLTSFDQIPETFERYIYVQFTMPATTVSHTTVRSVSVSSENPPEKYVKYAAKHDYRVEIDMSQGGEENEYTSAVTNAMNAANPPYSPSVGGDSPSKIISTHDEEDEDDSD